MTSVAYVAFVAPEHGKKERALADYLKIVERAKPKEADKARLPVPSSGQTQRATKATEATKAPEPAVALSGTPRDISDQRVTEFAPLTVLEALSEMNRWGSGAGRNAELYRRGELSEEKAVEYVTCAILHGRGDSFGAWKRHAPAVRKALGFCIHELNPKACKVCNGYVKGLIEEGRKA